MELSACDCSHKHATEGQQGGGRGGLPDLLVGLHRWSWPPRKQATINPAMDQDSPRPGRPVRQDVHLPAALFPPYGHYSFIARPGRCGAASWKAVPGKTRRPPSKTPIAWPIPPRCADGARAGFFSAVSRSPSLRETIRAVGAWLARTEILVHDSLPLRWHTVFPLRPVLALRI